MKIQSISYINGANFNSKINNSNKIQNSPRANVITELPSFTGGIKAPLSQESFINIEGKLHYENATLSGFPFDGELTTVFDGVRTNSRYVNGEKRYIRVSGENGTGGNGILFKNTGIFDKKGGSKNVYYKSVADSGEYIENYDEQGQLCQSELTRRDINSQNVILRTLTTYDEDGITPLESKTVVSPEYAAKVGFLEKTVKCENGKIKTASYKEYRSKGKLSDEAVIYYNKNQKPYRLEEKSIKFYAKNSDSVPYAIADESLTIFAKHVSIDNRYMTLNSSSGVHKLRSILYDEHPNTVRMTEGNTVSYYDGKTEELYAREQYKEGEEFPETIECIEEGITAKKKSLAINNFTYEISDGKSTIAHMLLNKQNGVFTPAMMDIYNREGMRAQTVHFYSDKIRTISHYSDRTTMTRKEEYVGEVLRAVNEYKDKELKKQTVTTETGGRRVVEINGSQATETIYERESDIPSSITIYENGIALQEKIMDEKGTIKAVKTYKDGINEDDPEYQAAKTLYIEELRP